MVELGLLSSNVIWKEYIELSVRILAAGICGGIIGIERSKRRKEAGIRTHIIVCIAAALMMIVSKYGFCDLVGADGSFFWGTDGTDPARIAAQVISGISFLGAGIIFHNKSSVRGLTTAAGIWATAGIGLALGSGMYYIGLFATAIIGIIQVVMHKSSIVADSLCTYQISFAVTDNSKVREAVEAYIKGFNSEIIESRIEYEEDGLLSYNYVIRTEHKISIEEVDVILKDKTNVKSLSVSMQTS